MSFLCGLFKNVFLHIQVIFQIVSGFLFEILWSVYRLCTNVICFRVMADRIENFDNGERALQQLDESIMNEPEYQLPEPTAMMSARSYKAKFVELLIAKLKSLIKTLFARYFKAIDSYNRLNVTNAKLYRENDKLSKINGKLTEENTRLRTENKDYSLLRRVFGHKQIDSLLEQARNLKGQKRDHTRSR